MERCTVYSTHMSNQKRRIVYMPDEEWEWVKARADSLGVSISALVRDAVRWVPPPKLPKQAERDAILRRIQKG